MKRKQSAAIGGQTAKTGRAAPKPAASEAAPPEGALDLSRVDLFPYLLNRLTARINQLWLDEIRGEGLTVQRFQVLSILAAFDGQRIGRIAEMSGNDQPVLSRVIDQMQRDGLVERRRSPGDSRVVEVWITPLGRKVFDKLSPAAARYVRRLVQSVDEADVKHVMTVLWTILGDLDEV